MALHLFGELFKIQLKLEAYYWVILASLELFMCLLPLNYELKVRDTV